VGSVNLQLRQKSLLSSFGENRVLHPHFRGVQTNYEATVNVFILFEHTSINFNFNNLKIPTKKIEPKIEKKLGVPQAFFQFLAQKILLEFSCNHD